MGRKILERVSKSRRVDETKSPRLHLFENSCMCGTTPDVRGVFHTGANNTPIQSKQLGWRKKTRRRPRAPNNSETCSEREIMRSFQERSEKRKLRILRTDEGLS